MMGVPLRQQLRSVAPYLKDVFMRSRAALGGGATLMVALAIYQTTAPHPLSPNACVIVILATIIFTQLWHGLTQFRETHPPFRLSYPKQQFWNESEQRGSTGTGYYVEVINSSKTEPLESVKAQLVQIDPPSIGNLPIPLHIRHKPYSPNDTQILIGPDSKEGFDVATGPDHNEHSQKRVLIPCVVAGDRGVTKAFPISEARHRLTIRVLSKNYSRDLILEVWAEDNFLRCEPRQTYVMGEL